MKDCILEKEEYVIKEIDGEKITVRQLQEEILTIMDEIDRICRKNNITYGLIAGSALGIVNYGGFIPWDDDIDIFILRKDWSKFIKALDQELDDNFYYHCEDCHRKSMNWSVARPICDELAERIINDEANIME